VWKVIAADMPLGLNVGDGSTAEGLPRWEAVATARECRHVRPERPRRDVRTATRVLQGAGLQFFGEVNIQSHSADLTVDLRDINGMSVFSKTLQPRLY
jgi:phosphodiesterase/alkaline phosphatase D-like protein